MKVKELVEKLNGVNPELDVYACEENHSITFQISSVTDAKKEKIEDCDCNNAFHEDIFVIYSYNSDAEV